MANAAPRGKPFAVGNQASPGRPKGARNRETVRLEAILRKSASEVVEAVVLMARSGSVPAMKLVMDRLLIPAKDRAVQIDLGATDTLAGIDVAHSVVLTACCDGSITPSEAASIAALLAGKRQAIDHTELEKRILDLEGRTMP